MDNKLKNWADNFKPNPQEDVWTKIVVKKNVKPKNKLSLTPNVVVGSIVVISIIILAIGLNFMHLFNAKNSNKKDTITIEKNK